MATECNGLSPALKKALIAQTACGNAELAAALEAEVCFIYDCQDNVCTPRLRYIYTQLGLIEYAQIFSRLQIDTATRVMQHVITEDYTATGRRNTDGEQTSTGKACNWAAATSQQYFNRDSTDDMVSFSDRNMKRTAEREEYGYDKSCRHTTGHAFNFSHVEHTVEDRSGEALGGGLGTEDMQATRVSSTNGGTGPFIPVAGLEYDPLGLSFSITPPFVNIQNVPNGVLPEIFPSGGDVICPPFDPEDPDPPDPCQRPAYPSYGQNYTAHIKISVGIPLLGALHIDWAYGHTYRQYYHCSLSSVNGQSSTVGRNDRLATVRTTALPTQNRSQSRETTNIYHLVRKFGTSTRRGLDTTKAQERQQGYSDGLSHAESKRDNKGNSFQQRRAESLTTGHTETHLRKEDHLTDDQVRRSFGQIGEQLSKLWKSTWANLLILQRQFAAVPYGASMSCNVTNRLGCNNCPPRQSYNDIRGTHGSSMSWSSH